MFVFKDLWFCFLFSDSGFIFVLVFMVLWFRFVPIGHRTTAATTLWQRLCYICIFNSQKLKFCTAFKSVLLHFATIVALCNTWVYPLITGFTYPPTIYFKFVTNCYKCYWKVRQLFFILSVMVCNYKVRQLFNYKVRQVLLQSATGITKRENVITKCDSFLLQSATSVITCLLYTSPSPRDA